MATAPPPPAPIKKPNEPELVGEKSVKMRLDPVTAILFTVGAFFGGQALAASLYVALAPLFFGVSGEQAFEIITDSVYAQFLYIFLAGTSTLLLLALFMKLRKVSLADIGLGRGFKLSDIGSALKFYVLYFLITIPVTLIAAQFVDAEQRQQIGFATATSPEHLIIVFVSLVIIPPIMEEIVFRGFLYTGLRTKMTKITSAILVSILFGLMHLQLGAGAPPLWIAMIDTTVLSLILVYAREKTGSIWASIFVHGLKNGLAFLLLFVVKSS